MGNFAENLNLGNSFRPPPPGGWVPHWLMIKKSLRKVQKIEARNAREPFAVGPRG